VGLEYKHDFYRTCKKQLHASAIHMIKVSTDCDPIYFFTYVRLNTTGMFCLKIKKILGGKKIVDVIVA